MNPLPSPRRRGATFGAVLAIAAIGLSACDFGYKGTAEVVPPPTNRPVSKDGTKKVPPKDDGRRPVPGKIPVPVPVEKKEVRIYRFNQGRWADAIFIDADGTFTPDRQPPDGLLLTESEAKLLEAEIKKGAPTNVAVIDFRPQIAFVSFKGDTVEQCIEVCLPCSRACVVKPGVHGRKEIKMDMEVVSRIAASHGSP